MRKDAMNRWLLAGLVGIGLAPGLAQAQNPSPYAAAGPRFYLQGGLGVSNQEIDRDDYYDDYYDYYRYRRRYRDDAAAFNLGVGVQFTPRWGMELSHVWLGKAHLRSRYDGDQKIDSRLFSLVGTYTYPFGASPWGVIGRAGLAYTDVSAQVEGGPGRSTHRAAPVLGIGGSYTFLPNLSVHVNYDYYGRVGRDAYDRPVLGGVLSAGLRWYID
ncbi:MAG: outer membrane beta-barrel protein [Burkholderiaceae bacterium]